MITRDVASFPCFDWVQEKEFKGHHENLRCTKENLQIDPAFIAYLTDTVREYLCL